MRILSKLHFYCKLSCNSLMYNRQRPIGKSQDYVYEKNQSTEKIWQIHVILMQDVSISACPSPMNISLIQEDLAVRPTDEVVLTCTLSGVPSTQVQFYWWLLHQTNTPIYIFSVSTNVRWYVLKCIDAISRLVNNACHTVTFSNRCILDIAFEWKILPQRIELIRVCGII